MIHKKGLEIFFKGDKKKYDISFAWLRLRNSREIELNWIEL